MNSPWGIEMNIIKETGFTRHYLLWQISWVNAGLMLADAPHFKKQAPKPKALESEDDFKDFLKL